MTLLRKLRAFLAIYSGCRHWPSVAAARIGIGDGGRTLRLRNGLELQVKDSLCANWGQFFESAIVDVYRVSAAEADIIVDVGANLGGFTCLAAWTHPKARVYAFEPQSDQANLLRHNIERNRLGNVVVAESPVTADGREVVLYRQSNEGASSIYLEGDGQTVPFVSVTLDSVPLADAESIFIKLDCEGAEGELIEWIAATVARMPQAVSIACEYHPWCPIPIEQSARRLSAAHFDISTEWLFAESYLFARRG